VNYTKIDTNQNQIIIYLALSKSWDICLNNSNISSFFVPASSKIELTVFDLLLLHFKTETG